MAKLTKRQATSLLNAYTKEQTAATEAAIRAKEAELDTALRQTEQAAASERAKVAADAAAALDRAAVNALIERYAIAERLQGMGLGSSGSYQAARESVGEAKTIAARRAKTAQATALSALSQKLKTAREKTAAEKTSYAAGARKSLAQKIAERKLTLNKQTM